MKFSTTATAAACLLLGAVPSLGCQREGIRRSLQSFARTLPDTPKSQRFLKRAEECFYKCVAFGLTGDECKQFIEGQLGPDLSGHEMPGLSIEISHPRDPQAKEDTYHLVGIPTNIDGEVSCNLNGGVITYPYEWVTPEGSFAIPDVNCAGLDAVACCGALKDTMLNAEIPLVDENGRCISCWTHQEILVPSMGEGDDVTYSGFAFDGSSCVESPMTPEEVDAQDAAQEATVSSVISKIDAALTGATCEQLEALQSELLIEARAFPAAMTTISDLLCGYCDDVSAYKPLPEDLVNKLNFIKVRIAGEINSAQNIIVIYTDHQGLVMEPPHIGGSREELDWDRDDADCPPETEPLAPGESPPPPTFSDGSPIPEGYATCDSELLSTESAEGQDCYDCRDCLYKLCDWDEASFCNSVFAGTQEASPGEWLACLESNGVASTSLPGDAANENGFDNWCHCAVKCEQRCLLRTNRLDECGANNMKDKNCGTCRECLKDSCEHWDNHEDTYCQELLDGEKGARNPDEWLACMENDGKSKSINPDLKRDDKKEWYYLRSNNWAPCTRKCDDACHKVEEVDERNEECGAENIDNSKCTECRSCLKDTCVWGEEDVKETYCWKLLNGQVKSNTAAWLACLESDGASKVLVDQDENRDQLSYDYGRRETWAECGRKCDEVCVKTKRPDRRWRECGAKNMKKEECTTCRECIKDSCDLGGGGWCYEVVHGLRTTSTTRWLACLETNGGSKTLKDRDDELITRDQLHVDFGRMETWADCARTCDDKCLVKEALPDPGEGQCGAKEIKSEYCEDCRDCIDESCQWPAGVCADALSGKGKANTDQWLACLENNGSSNELKDSTEGRDQYSVDYGRRGTWADCARKCDDRCVEKEPYDGPPLTPICTVEDLSARSGPGGICEPCRVCMEETCFYFRDKCEQMIRGEVTGSDEDWAQCLEQCGGGLAPEGRLRGRYLEAEFERVLTTNDGLGTPRSTWCSCARECDDSCHHPEE